MSLREVEAWRTSLGQRLIELRYEDLTRDPVDTLRAVMSRLRLSCENSWLQRATAGVNPAKRNSGEPLVLPDSMRTDFNRIQASFGFKGERCRILCRAKPRRMVAGKLRQLCDKSDSVRARRIWWPSPIVVRQRSDCSSTLLETPNLLGFLLASGLDLER